MITREQITGAIKALNAGEVSGRRDALRKMLEKEHAKKDVEKVLADLDSYPAWGLRRDLDEAVESATDPIGKPKKGK